MAALTDSMLPIDEVSLVDSGTGCKTTIERPCISEVGSPRPRGVGAHRIICSRARCRICEQHVHS
eukprot:NODE_19413_length_844_cov_4.006974.p6 GENE.NODE_19413_length_844_cov_4.006974~~NODE_19413_length_844_cov_4.006974.p6  ORF type:complete len:65 (-),score=4.37 NODE_19413_length_844_cov_4.006974:515-709(-)